MEWKWNRENGLVKLAIRLFSKQRRREAHVGRLGPKPHQSPGPGYQPRHAELKKTKVAHVINPWRACDRCGYSSVDGKPIARAKWQIEVPGGTLYLCGHHYQKHEFAIVVRGYAAYNIEETVPA